MWITLQSLYNPENHCTLTLYYLQDKGLTVNDTDMRLVIDKENKTVNATALEQHPNIRNEVLDAKKDMRLQDELNKFLSEWLTNIEKQGYKPEVARLTIDESKELTDDTVYFNSDGKPYNLAFMYDNSGNTTVYNRLDNSGDHGAMKIIAEINSNNPVYVSVTHHEDNLPAEINKIIETKTEEAQAKVLAKTENDVSENKEPVGCLNFVSSGEVMAYYSDAEIIEAYKNELYSLGIFGVKFQDVTDEALQKKLTDIYTAEFGESSEPVTEEIIGTFDEKYYPPYEGVLPDPTISLAERNEYGYIYDGLLPLNRKRALELYDNGCEIFVLYTDNAEGAVDDRNDFFTYDGIFGIEVESWESYLEREASLHKTNEAIEDNEADIIMPDPGIGFSERDLYGYKAADILPLLKNRALELFDADHTVYMLYADGTEAMVFDRSEISTHDGIFGIDAGEWAASREYSDMVKPPDKSEALKEASLIFGSENAYAIYQLKRSDATRNLHFEPFDRLQSKGLNAERKNYELVYHEVTDEIFTTGSLYAKFNFERPEDFTGHSLSVSDVIVMQKDGVVSSYYVDSSGFKELSAFLDNENSVDYESAGYQQRRTGELLQEHISNHLSGGYLAKEDERLLQDNIDTIGDKFNTISNLYESGMPLDVETDTVDRLFRDILDKSREQSTPAPEKQTGFKQPSILSQLQTNLNIVAQNKGTPTVLKHSNSKEEV